MGPMTAPVHSQTQGFWDVQPSPVENFVQTPPVMLDDPFGLNASHQQLPWTPNVATPQQQHDITKESMESPVNGNSDHFDHATGQPQVPVKQRKPYDYGGNPLAHINTGDSVRLPAFGGDFQPGLYKPPTSKFANPAPLGLSAFALTTFVLSLINLGTRGLHEPNIVVGAAFAYGGLVQLLAGMW